MPEDVEGQPSQGDGEPDDRDQGAADDGFASVVFDESFVRAARVHEPTAVERERTAAQFRAEAEAARAYEEQYGHGRWDAEEADRDAGPEDEGAYGDDGDEGDHRFGPYGAPTYASGSWEQTSEEYAEYAEHAEYAEYADEDGVPPGRPLRPYRGHLRWQRPIAWLLVVAMGVGVVALALAAVHRSASPQRQQTPVSPSVTSGADTPAVVPAGVPAASLLSGGPPAASPLFGGPPPAPAEPAAQRGV